MGRTKEKRQECKQIEKKGIWNIEYTIIPSYFEKEMFLNKDEHKLYRCLEEIFKNTKIKIFCQVALNQIVNINTRRGYKQLYDNYCSRSIDFVLYDLEREKIYCCIELNGSSHNLENRKERDKFLKEVFQYTKIPIIFISTSEYYKQNEVKEIIDEEIINKRIEYKKLTNIDI